jgi:Zn-dependent peptidase ImmA (M78 family)
MDPWRASLDGVGEPWHEAARARAFGVALLLPEEGIRAVLTTSRTVDEQAVRDIGLHFNVGPVPVVRRLQNLRYISADESVRLLGALGAEVVG